MNGTPITSVSQSISTGTRIRFEADLSYEDGTSPVEQEYRLYWGADIVEQGTFTGNYFILYHKFDTTSTDYKQLQLSFRSKGAYIGNTGLYRCKIKVV